MRKLDKKHKKEIIIFILILLLEIVIFIPWLKGHFATDTYQIIDIGYKEFGLVSLKNGRFFMYLIMLLVDLINIPINVLVIVMLFLGLVVSTLSCLLIRKIILEYKKENTLNDTIIIVMLSFVTIFNFMYIEILYFIESFIMATSVFINIYIAKLLTDKRKHYLLKSLILTIISTLMYQGTIGVLIFMYAFILIMKYPESPKKIVKEFLKGMVIVGGGIFINILFVKLINFYFDTENVRAGSIKSIFYNIVYIFIFMLQSSRDTS